jgi:hypothetical protein
MQWAEKWIGQPIEQWDEREKQKVAAGLDIDVRREPEEI